MRVAVDRLAQPPSTEWLRGRIVSLLAHYFVADGDERIMGAVADDWVAAMLVDPAPPQWAVQQACVAYLAGSDARRRPVPAQIRDLAITAAGWIYKVRSRLFLEDHPEARSWHPLARVLPPVPDAPADYEARRQQVAELLGPVLQNIQEVKDAQEL